MIRVKQAIIVEGRYDKIRLSNIVDTAIICTNGFPSTRTLISRN